MGLHPGFYATGHSFQQRRLHLFRPGRSGDGGAGASGLRAAVDAAVRICSEFAAACRRLEQHLIERRKMVEREREHPPRGMSR